MDFLENITGAFAGFVWDYPVTILLIGGGLFFTIYMRLGLLRYVKHAFEILGGKFGDTTTKLKGQLTPFEALSSALASTVGMGNISGVAVAMTAGGPGALFWMWVSAVVGIGTKFFTCSLAVMYKGRDSAGEVQGGPMYVITEGLGKNWKPMAIFFAIPGLFGCLPAFQANQLTELVRNMVFIENGWMVDNPMLINIIIGLIVSAIVAAVVFGGLKRIASVATRAVPGMVLIYMLSAIVILALNFEKIIPSLTLIITDAFTGEAIMGGAVGSLIILGVRRAAFSNEAGMGTSPMAHGAANTKEPIQEGLVAMLEPIIDTLIVCTITGLVIVITDSWYTKVEGLQGITLTANAFESVLPGVGKHLILGCTVVFAITTMFSYSYYSTKCFGFLFGASVQRHYRYFYVLSVLLSSVVSISVVLNIIDGMFGLMCIPTMISTLILAPKVRKAALEYFAKRREMNSA